MRVLLFNELYSAYYNTVAAVLRAAVTQPLGEKEMRTVIESRAFGESALNILPALKDGRWQLMREDGSTVIRNKPTLPLTVLQKRWLKAIARDPRIRLFGENHFDFPDVEPLFTAEDYLVFDRYSDGDDYEDPVYISNFRVILDAVKNGYRLEIETRSRRGTPVRRTFLPEYLEYSEKDDKFRLVGKGGRTGSTINLGRILRVERSGKTCLRSGACTKKAEQCAVVMQLTDRRNALERVMLHFAHFKKQAEKTGDGTYTVTVFYDKEDETEIVIRILSFGPMIRVTAPDQFVELIKKRLSDQKSCGQ